MRDALRRIPWLLLLFLMGLAVSSVIKSFEWVVSEVPVIVAFQSLILGMAGNVGTQSLAVTVREIAKNTGRGFGKKLYLSLLLREAMVAFFCGCILGAFSVVAVFFYLYLLTKTAARVAIYVAICVGGAMGISMWISGAMGVVIPSLMRFFGTDPAIASGPLITTVSDITAVISYYGLVILLMAG